MARKRSVDVREMCDSPTVIAIDPGGTTGWCVFQCHPEALIDDGVLILENIDYWLSGQFTGSEDQQAEDITNLIVNWPGCAVVIEDFVLRKFSPDRDLLSPVRITAKVEHRLWQEGLTFFLQQPSEAKTTATDARLKEWKLYKPGEEHGRDATRHAITFMRKAKTRTMLRMYAWTHLYGLNAEYGMTQEELRRESERIRKANNINSKAREGFSLVVPGVSAEKLAGIG